MDLQVITAIKTAINLCIEYGASKLVPVGDLMNTTVCANWELFPSPKGESMMVVVTLSQRGVRPISFPIHETQTYEI